MRQANVPVAMSDLIRNPSVDELCSQCQASNGNPEAKRAMATVGKAPPAFTLLKSHSIDTIKRVASKQTGVSEEEIEDCFPLSPFQMVKLEPCISGSLKDVPSLEFMVVGSEVRKSVDLDKLKASVEKAAKAEPVSVLSCLRIKEIWSGAELVIPVQTVDAFLSGLLERYNMGVDAAETGEVSSAMDSSYKTQVERRSAKSPS